MANADIIVAIAIWAVIMAVAVFAVVALARKDSSENVEEA